MEKWTTSKVRNRKSTMCKLTQKVGVIRESFGNFLRSRALFLSLLCWASSSPKSVFPALFDVRFHYFISRFSKYTHENCQITKSSMLTHRGNFFLYFRTCFVCFFFNPSLIQFYVVNIIFLWVFEVKYDAVLFGNYANDYSKIKQSQTGRKHIHRDFEHLAKVVVVDKISFYSSR